MPSGPPMDVWSAALVGVKLLLERPLFPGDDEDEQRMMTAELLGEPDQDLVRSAKRYNEFFEDGKLIESSHHEEVSGSQQARESTAGRAPWPDASRHSGARNHIPLNIVSETPQSP
jgi:hypothetical protein